MRVYATKTSKKDVFVRLQERQSKTLKNIDSPPPPPELAHNTTDFRKLTLLILTREYKFS